MFSRTTRREIATIDYSANNTITTQLTGLTGRVRALYAVLEGTLVVSTAGTNYLQTRNPGTLIPSLTLRLNNSQVLKQGAWNDWRDRAYCFTKTGEETKVTAATAATYPFISRINLPFITPRGAKPIDTILQLGTNDRLDLDITFADDEALIASTTAQSFSVSPTVTIVAELEAYIPEVTPDPIGVYKESTTEWNIGAAAVANWQTPVLIVAPNLEYHSIIMVEEDAVANTGRARVSTITDVTLQQQGGGYVSQPFGLIEGNDMQHWYNQRNRLVDSVRTGVYPICWQADAEGRVTYNLDTTSLSHLNLQLNIADPGANGYLRVLTGSIERF